MKTKALFLLLTGCLLALAAWLVQMPNAAQAEQVPEKYRETVHKGLEYLAKNQFEDGHWEGEGGRHPVAMTGLVGLALLLDCAPERRGSPADRKYSANVRKAVNWLMDKSRPDGLIFSEHPSETSRYMDGHGLATLFLAGAYINVDRDRTSLAEKEKLQQLFKLHQVLKRAIGYIVKVQSNQGGWHHTSRLEGHDFASPAATVIQVQALQTADNADISGADHAIHDAQEYLSMMLAKHEQQAGPGQNRRATETAAALVCRVNTQGRADELGQKWLSYCRTGIPLGRDIQFGRDELAHYYYAQTLFNLGHTGKDIDDRAEKAAWEEYRTAIFDHLQKTQTKDGSWPAPLAPQEGIGVGPVCATAVWCTILQLDRNRHPSKPQLQPVK